MSEKNIFLHNHLEKCTEKVQIYSKVEANIVLGTYLYLYNNMNDLYTDMGNFLQLFFLILSFF